MKRIVLLFISIVFISCADSKKLKSEIKELKNNISKMNSSVQEMQNALNENNSIIEKLKTDLKSERFLVSILKKDIANRLETAKSFEADNKPDLCLFSLSGLNNKSVNRRTLKSVKKLNSVCQKKYDLKLKKHTLKKINKSIAEGSFSDAQEQLKKAKYVFSKKEYDNKNESIINAYEDYKLKQKLSRQNNGGNYTLDEIVRITQNKDIDSFGDYLPKGTLHITMDEGRYETAYSQLKSKYPYLTYEKIGNIIFNIQKMRRETCPLKLATYIDVLNQLVNISSNTNFKDTGNQLSEFAVLFLTSLCGSN
jgi:hypothetical protein